MNPEKKTTIKLEETSKTQRKKEAQDLKELGKELTKFTAQQLQSLPLSDKLIAELLEFNRLPNSHGAKKRQLQFIGKLMRANDALEIRDAIPKLPPKSRKASSKKNEISTWCDKILHGSDGEISESLIKFPNTERQILRQFQREFARAKDSRRSTLKTKLIRYLQN
jgi:ribosome-associated protein